MERSTTTPDALLASLPSGVREDMTALDAALAPVFAGHERVLWEGPMWGGTHQRIIGYGTFPQGERSGKLVDWFVVGLAAQNGYLSLYVNAVEDGQYLGKRWASRLGKVKIGSASIGFKRLTDVDLPAIVELATRARDLVLGAA